MDRKSEEIERYRAAVELLRMEVDRVFQTFGAFLLAEAVVGAFLLNAAVSNQTDPWILVAGALFGAVLCALWLSAYERGASTYAFRLALADAAEPDGWRLLRGRSGFSDGETVGIRGRDHRIVRVGRIKARNAVRTLIGLFFAAYLGVLAIAIVRLT